MFSPEAEKKFTVPMAIFVIMILIDLSDKASELQVLFL